MQDRPALDALSSLYYGRRPPTVATGPRLGSPTLRLEFRNPYVSGIVGSRAFDRFLSNHIDA